MHLHRVHENKYLVVCKKGILAPRGQRQLENAIREREQNSCFDFSGIFLTSEVGARGLMNFAKKNILDH